MRRLPGPPGRGRGRDPPPPEFLPLDPLWTHGGLSLGGPLGRGLVVLLKGPTRRGSEGPGPRSAPLQLSWAPACVLPCHPALSSAGRLRLALGPAFPGRGVGGNPPCPAARFRLPRRPVAVAALDGRPPPPHPALRLQEGVGPHDLICFWLLLLPLKSTPSPVLWD